MQQPQAPTRTKYNTALIDADIVVYAGGFSAERVHYDIHLEVDGEVQETPAFSSTVKKEVNQYLLDNSIETYELRKSLEVEDISHALSNAKNMLLFLEHSLPGADLQLFLSGKGNFREQVATYKKYKGQREVARVPVYKQEITDYLIKHWGAVVVDGQEADDELGILQMKDEGTIICSIDKDLKQIPGYHFHMKSGSVINQPLEDADRMFFLQVMTGDSTDNIPGCPGIGPQTALKYYDPDDPWGSVLQCYRDKLSSKCPEDFFYDSEEDLVEYTGWESKVVQKSLAAYAIEQAQLVRIRRTPNELWRPNE